MSGRPAISARNLSKRFGDTIAVDRASFDVPYGSVTGFIGANGSGKSTTMRMLLGLVAPSTGEALIDGAPYRELVDPRRTVGCVLDRLGAHPGLSGRSHLRFVATGAGIHRGEMDLVIEQVLKRVGLVDAADRKLGGYSTGMKQRLALAAALLAEPRVLLLDEPARGLDPAGIRWMRAMLRESADSGAAVFVSTHQLAELASVVDHVVVIGAGQIVAAEPAADLLARTGETTLEDAVFALTDLEFTDFAVTESAGLPTVVGR